MSLFFRLKLQKINLFDHFIFNKSSEHKIKYYIPTKQVLFNNGRYTVFETDKYEKKITKIFNKVISIFTPPTFYFFIKNLYLIKPLSIIFWGISFYCAVNTFIASIQNSTHFIYELNLMKDGKHIELKKHFETSIEDISKVRRLTNEENLYFNDYFHAQELNFLPIVIDNKIYLINKKIIVNDKEIFSAISNGKYIELNKEKVMDIK
jgi:hypothetical protein